MGINEPPSAGFFVYVYVSTKKIYPGSIQMERRVLAAGIVVMMVCTLSTLIAVRPERVFSGWR